MGIDAASAALAVARGLHDAGALSLFGAMLFRLAVAPNAASPAAAAMGVDGLAQQARRLRLLVRISLAVALVAGAAWLLLQVASIAAALSWSNALAVLEQTRFGELFQWRMSLLLVGSILGGVSGLLLVAAGVCIEVWMGHAAASGGDQSMWPTLVEAAHLLAAGAWLGGLLPLFLVVKLARPVARAFTPLGVVAVLLLAATALVQAITLVGGLPGLLGTEYGLAAGVKLATFVLMLGLAVVNRAWLTPLLERRRSGVAWLRASILAEAALGLLAVGAAATMAGLPPGVHAQPVWPFRWQFSLDALARPERAREILYPVACGAAAALLALLALVPLPAFLQGRRRRGRWPLLAGAVAALAAAVWLGPSLGLLLVPAYPTSFYRSPSGFTAASILRGGAVYGAECARCHGEGGRGDGPDAHAASVPASDLTATGLWDHTDGELFWWMTQGMKDEHGAAVMPGFGDRLSENDRWAVIDWIRARNLGAGMAASGRWPHPARAPDIAVFCPNGRRVTLADFGGRPVRVLAEGGGAPVLLPDEGVSSIVLTRSAEAAPATTCVANAPEAWAAFALVAGIAPNALDGTLFLVDGNGWLRARWLAGEAGRPQGLAAWSTELHKVEAHPIAPPEPGPHQ
jgi:putative copper export protein